MPVIHQLLAGYRPGDAIGAEADAIAALCEAHGMAARLWSPRATTAPEGLGRCGNVRALPAAVRPDDVALLHLSIGSPANEVFRSLPCRRVVLYHNVTPPRFFGRTAPATAAVLEEGLRQVRSLAGAAHASWAVSRFNADELERMGWSGVRVFPLLVPEGFARGPVDPGVQARLSDPPADNLLFVGRLAPNKRHDRLLRIFRAYQRANPSSRLVLAGRTAGAEPYLAMLLGMSSVLALRGVWFTDYLRADELAACYATASAFVCASDHEGFCAPLLEAMSWRIPVFAAACAAVPETLDGAGVLFAPDAPPEAVAETISRVLRDPALREAVLKRQDERLARFHARDAWKELKEVLFG